MVWLLSSSSSSSTSLAARRQPHQRSSSSNNSNNNNNNNNSFQTSASSSVSSFSSRPSSSRVQMDAPDKDETAVDEPSTPTTTAKTVHSTWNLARLKQQVLRRVLRTHKKIGKAHTRLSNNERNKTTTATNNVTTTAMEYELQGLQETLAKLNHLEQALQSLKGKNIVLPSPTAELVLELGIHDHDDDDNNNNNNKPQHPARGAKKKKGPRVMQPSRLPYRRYYTENQTEIRVGKQAQDNDNLSLLPEHRDGSDWWMHASGCSGSHVVIRCGDQHLDDNVVRDAAALAARQSKCSGSVIKVSLTRCRDVKKPPGAKAGLVQLTGSVRTVSVNMKDAQSRLDRLDETVLVN